MGNIIRFIVTLHKPGSGLKKKDFAAKVPMVRWVEQKRQAGWHVIEYRRGKI